MDYLIATHHLEPQAIVSIRDRRKQDDLPGFLKAAFPELLGRLRLLGVTPSGPPFVIYHEFGTQGIDSEVSVPIGEPIAAAGKIESRVLPAMTVARTAIWGHTRSSGTPTWRHGAGSGAMDARSPVRSRSDISTVRVTASPRKSTGPRSRCPSFRSVSPRPYEGPTDDERPGGTVAICR